MTVTGASTPRPARTRTGYDGPVIPLLVTRPAEEAAALCARLGPHAIPAPCLAFAAVGSPRPDLADADLLVASPRAVGPLAAVGVPPRWNVLALAPATVAALRDAGLPVHRAIEGGGADLAAAARPDAPVVAATSTLGGDEVLRVRPDAFVWVLYATICPAELPAPARAALDAPFDVLFTSPSAVRNFAQLAPGVLDRARRVLCHGGTTLAEVARHGRAGERFTLPDR